MILEDTLKYLDIEPRYADDPNLSDIPDVSVPDLIGKAIR